MFTVSEVEPGCGEGHFLINNENIISALVDTKHERTTTLCQLVVEARTGYRVRAIINYSPVVPHDCQRHFVHIGNDRHRLNKQSLTSYKYCNKTISEEIVSRKNFLWIVYSKRENEADLRIEISALKEGMFKVITR